jgi:hypothetical protein
VDDGPAAPAAAHSLSGPALDAACLAVAGLARHAAIAGPAWWDANAPAAPWSARRSLDFCAELALALAAVHEAGAAQGELGPRSVAMRPDGGPLVRAPYGAGGRADDLHGLGALLLFLLTGRSPHAGLVVAGEIGPAAEAATLLQSLLDADPAARPSSARQVAARLSEIASSVPDTTPAPAAPARRSRGRLATAVVLLLIAGAAGGYLVGHRVGPPGPALSPTTVTVPSTPAVSP